MKELLDTTFTLKSVMSALVMIGFVYWYAIGFGNPLNPTGRVKPIYKSYSIISCLKAGDAVIVVSSRKDDFVTTVYTPEEVRVFDASLYTGQDIQDIYDLGELEVDTLESGKKFISGGSFASSIGHYLPFSCEEKLLNLYPPSFLNVRSP